MAKKKKQDKVKKGVVLFLAFATTLAFTPFLIPPSLFQQPSDAQYEEFLEFQDAQNNQGIQFDIPEEGITEEELMKMIEDRFESEEEAGENQNEEEQEKELEEQDTDF